ncbi:hypothetical protein [Curtobacterium flaccumfaciens]|uniref:hypothetical protein n=1 Tax=Curtobacterium flaccumfaciens TaxID=2035 RepID=UPI001E5BB55E|nr:hypothetical protein [Curtobacterium allii]MCE0458450.1 hypothetical protein [Curtobacterium allii]
MAVGDAAGAAGLKTYGDNLLVTDIDVALNQRGDELATALARVKTLEAQSINVPKFFVKRSANGQQIVAEGWRLLGSGAWAAPQKNVGGFTWSGGVLTVPKAGQYLVTGHVMYRNDDFRTAAFNITRNSTVPDSTAVICGNETTVQSPTEDSSLQLGVSSTETVGLNAGDELRFYTFQRNRGADTVNIGNRAFDLSMNVLWLDTL